MQRMHRALQLKRDHKPDITNSKSEELGCTACHWTGDVDIPPGAVFFEMKCKNCFLRTLVPIARYHQLNKTASPTVAKTTSPDDARSVFLTTLRRVTATEPKRSYAEVWTALQKAQQDLQKAQDLNKQLMDALAAVHGLPDQFKQLVDNANATNQLYPGPIAGATIIDPGPFTRQRNWPANVYINQQTPIYDPSPLMGAWTDAVRGVRSNAVMFDDAPAMDHSDALYAYFVGNPPDLSNRNRDSELAAQWLHTPNWVHTPADDPAAPAAAPAAPVEAINAHIRDRMREEGFFRRIMPPHQRPPADAAAPTAPYNLPPDVVVDPGVIDRVDFR